MGSLHDKSSTPLRRVRTPVSGLVALGIVMWAVARWRSQGRTGKPVESTDPGSPV